MSILKKADMNHRSANRRAIQGSHRPAVRNEGTGDRSIPFSVDFNMEHCYPGVKMTLITIPAPPDSAGSGIPRGGFAEPTASPSCVYLG